MQKTIGVFGLMGLIVFLLLAAESPAIIRYYTSGQSDDSADNSKTGANDQAIPKGKKYQEMIVLKNIFFTEVGLAIIMAALGVLWGFVLTEKDSKYKKYLVAIYFSPLVIGLLFIGFAVLESAYWTNKFFP